MVASCFRTYSRASRSFLVACSVARSARVLPPLAIAFSTASSNTSFNALRTLYCNPGASCVTTVPMSTAIGLARPGLPGTRRLEGESVMTAVGVGRFTDPRAALSDCSDLTSAQGCCHSGCVPAYVPGSFFTCERAPN